MLMQGMDRDTFSGTLCNVYSTWTKCKQTQYVIDRALLGKMRGVNATAVADVDKGQ